MWQQIDTAPKDERLILIWLKGTNRMRMIRADDLLHRPAYLFGLYGAEATHWHPVPNPPPSE